MKDLHSSINKIIEKIIILRIDEIIKIGNIKNTDEIKSVNKIIAKNGNIDQKKNKMVIPTDEKKLTLYTTFIKDANNLIKNKNNLNYLPNNIVNRIKSYKDKSAKDKFKEFSIIWKELDDNIKDKYRNLCKDKNFTNSEYDKITDKIPKIIRKKKSNESLHY